MRTISRFAVTKIYVVLTVVLFFNLISASCQTLPLIGPGSYSYSKREQLKGNIDSAISFSIKPLSIEALDSIVLNYSITKLGKNRKSEIDLFLLPINFNFEYNSRHPYGANNGPMVPMN